LSICEFADVPAAAALPWHVNTTSTYSSNGIVRIASPSTDESHHLVLFLSRTGGSLPLHWKGWTKLGECFKTKDKQRECFRAEDCIEYTSTNEKYCTTFSDGSSGKDLATVVYYRKANPYKSSYSFRLRQRKRHPTWAIMTALNVPDLNEAQPLRDLATKGCDGSIHGVFPPVYGTTNDIMLLSLAYDDAVDNSVFAAPDNTDALGYVVGDDETGVLYGTQLHETGYASNYITTGSGSYQCKDGLIALTLRVGS